MEGFKILVPPEHYPLIEDITLKFKLFMGHSIRVTQVNKMIVKCLQSLYIETAFINMDFKLKFETFFS